MKTKITLLLLFPATLLFAREKVIVVSVTNPASVFRQNEIVSLDFKAMLRLYALIQEKTFSISIVEDKPSFGVVTGGNMVSPQIPPPEFLPYQLIDGNEDGKAEELMFQVSLKPSETKKYYITISNEASDTIGSMVDGRFVLPREDFAWENDRVAFRVYGAPIAGNVLNGIDVWTKRVRYPIIKKWYAGEEQTPKIVYHEDHGEGADFFSVGRSLGCGSAGILRNGKLVQAGLFSYYRIITNGPLRISFELYYPDWQIDTVKYLEVKRITLDAGSQLNKIETRFIPEAPAGPLTIAAGLVKRSNTTFKRSADTRWMALWGLTNADSVNGYLGTGVVFPHQENVTATEDSSQYLLLSTVITNEAFTYYTGFAWTRQEDIKSQQEWNKYLEDFTTKVNNPLRVTFQKKK